MSIVEEVDALFAGARLQHYLGEPVTLAEHMLQAAALAEADGAPDALVAGALLHDVGHILASAGVPHEVAAAEWLNGCFPVETCEAVRLHVAAKRYLCATEPTYFDRLSTASRQSLLVQGGPMQLCEVQSFEREPHFDAAVRLRRWDEAAKDPGAFTPPFEHFRPLLQRVLGRA